MTDQPWPQTIPPEAQQLLDDIWLPVGLPGHAGNKKAGWNRLLDERFGAGNWRISHYVRGRIVSKTEAIQEYEHGYRVYLHSHPQIVRFLTTVCGNVYDDNPTNVHDASYHQPATHLNHYQDITVRRIISELVDDPAWPDVIDTPAEETDLIDLKTGQVHRMPRARGFRGQYVMQVREPDTPGFFLNPACIPAHDPSLITTLPGVRDWYFEEGCGHLSIEAFWQMSKVIEVRYSRFLALNPADRFHPLAGLP